MTSPYRIAAISGSLRKDSYNTALLRAARELQPAALALDVITLEDTPLFNEDVEAVGWPPEIQALRERVEPAEGVIFATPEYNYGVTGALKNAIDWLSRPTGKGPIVGKPAAIIGASMSGVGTARAQMQLRDALFYNAMPLLSSAEVLVARAQSKFDEDGRLTDEETREFLKSTLEAFAELVWLHSHAGGR